MVIYHDHVNMDSDGPVEVCVPIAGLVEPFGNARVRLEPAHVITFARIIKREVQFPEILDAYAAVETWLKENNRKLAGAPREIYIADWSTIGADQDACDIAFPVAD